MKKIKKLLIGSALTFTLFGSQLHADAASNYEVKSGDTLWKIATKYGVSIDKLKRINNQKTDQIFAGESIIVPSSISRADRNLMARLVSAEAKGESYAGKVAVATVILNRVDHPNFPDSIKGVVYQVSNGYYAFSPVKNGAINKAADADSIKAVNEALALRGKGQGSLYFYNPTTAKSNWIKTRTVTTTIGSHTFAK